MAKKAQITDPKQVQAELGRADGRLEAAASYADERFARHPNLFSISVSIGASLLVDFTLTAMFTNPNHRGKPIGDGLRESTSIEEVIKGEGAAIGMLEGVTGTTGGEYKGQEHLTHN